MFKPTKKQISSFIGLTALLGIFAILAYAAVFFSASTQPIGYIGQPTLSNYNVTSGQEKIYRGMYNNYDWSGQFSCYPVAANGYVNLAAPCFTAGAGSPLDVQAAANTRLIGTLSDATTPAGVEFSTAGLTTAQQTALGGTTANINWIRGTSLSPTGLRARTTVLGDIIHSRPYYWADAANNNANPTVFVGANDGMLHAFDASACTRTPTSTTCTAGDERWAYVPSMLISAAKMGALPSAAYVHDYFVDGSIAIANVPSTTTTPVLVGALGAGGKGLYALSLASLTAANGTATGGKALWEITNTAIKCGPASSGCTNGTTTTYANLGYTYSNPVIVPTQDGNTSVVVGNGYNNNGNGHASLYVINAATGTLIREIDTGIGTTTSPNGLSSVTVIDSNGDGKGDRAYAGDINGNMWVFDLSSSNKADWSYHLLYSQSSAITVAPAISVHPWGGYMVNFATGRILSQAGAAIIPLSTTAAIDDTTDQTTAYAAYGLWDKPASLTNIPTSSLIAQSITGNTYTPPTGSPATMSIPVISLTTDNRPNWATNLGWTVPLRLQGGERVTGDNVFVDNGKFVFNVTNPAVAYTPPGASASTYGVNYQVELDYLTGGAGTIPFLDLNQDGLINSLDLLLTAQGAIPAGGTTVTPATLIPVGYITSNGVQSQPILIQLASTRISLYNQNYNAANSGNIGTGVNGGHFDVDVFYNSSGSFKKITHDHEYDKTYDTNGLNPLNPNDKTYRLSAVPGITATTAYKVLVMNQGWNRAINLRIGTWAGSTRDYQTMLSTDVLYPGSYDSSLCGLAPGIGCLKLSTLPTFTGTASKVSSITGGTPVAGVDYTMVPLSSTTDVAGKINILNVTTTGSIGCMSGASASVPSGCTTTSVTSGARASVGGLELSMPSNGFNIKDWWQIEDGDKSAGVMPITPSCAYGVNSDGSMPANGTVDQNYNNINYFTGPNGERHDGVLTLQIIRDTTQDADVRMNVPGQPIYGFRVIDSKIKTDVLAEFTLYWHHPNTECMGDGSSDRWSTTNNAADPWWPAQETVPTNFKSSTANNTATTKGILTCVSGKMNNASGTPSWKTTANAAAKTAPYSGSVGNTTGPAGWTKAPPQDSATTLPPCPTYNQLYDDPRTASFINPSVGSNGSSTLPTTSTAVTAISSGMGGNTSGGGGGTTGGTTGGATGGTTGGSAASGVPPTNTSQQTGSPPVSGRINWRELIGL